MNNGRIHLSIFVDPDTPHIRGIDRNDISKLPRAASQNRSYIVRGEFAPGPVQVHDDFEIFSPNYLAAAVPEIDRVCAGIHPPVYVYICRIHRSLVC